MEESAESVQREELEIETETLGLSDDEDTVEFEIEVVTSSGSSEPSRAPTPARDDAANADQAGAAAISDTKIGQQQQVGEIPATNLPNNDNEQPNVTIKGPDDEAALEQATKLEPLAEPEELTIVELKQVQVGTSCFGSLGVEPVGGQNLCGGLGDKFVPIVSKDEAKREEWPPVPKEKPKGEISPGTSPSAGNLGILLPPSGQQHQPSALSTPGGADGETIPLGGPLEGDAGGMDSGSTSLAEPSNEANQVFDHSDTARACSQADSVGVDYGDDLKGARQGPQSCRRMEASVESATAPLGAIEVSAEPTTNQESDTASVHVVDSVLDAVKATSDSGDGCEWRLVREAIPCPAGWSLIEANSLDGQLKTTTIEQVELKEPLQLEQATMLQREASLQLSDSQQLGQQQQQMFELDLTTIQLVNDQSLQDERAHVGCTDSTAPVEEQKNEKPLSEPLEETVAITIESGEHVCLEGPKEAPQPPPPQVQHDEVSVQFEEAPATLVEVESGAFEEPPSVELENADTATTRLEASKDDGDNQADDEFQANVATTNIQAAAEASSDPADQQQQQFVADQLVSDRLSSSSSLHLLNSDNLFEDEDLEREFDEEPDFQKRNVQVKRNVNPRDHYELGDELGRGRFGTVFRCVELASGLKLAAKFVHMRRREDREDVEREVGIMSVLQHKRLLQLYDAFDDGLQEMCLITELVEGGELFERIVDDDFDLTEKKAAIFMRQICEGVEYMHSEHIVHLDMKPENILCLSRTGMRIKLIDFGLARRLDPQKPIRVLFGTPDFAAPEVLAYETVTLATDMWSVGVICYVLLSGLSPFMGDSDMDTMANVMRATFDFNDAAFEAISELAKDFISKLLVREPGQRLKPSECLKHAWLQRGGGPLEAHIRDRRESSFSLVLGGHHHRPTLEQVAMLTSLAAASAAAVSTTAPGSSGPTPPTPPSQLNSSTTPSFMNMRPRGSFGAESSASASHQSLDKRRLKRYVVRRKWHKTVHAIMALGRMGANLKLALD